MPQIGTRVALLADSHGVLDERVLRVAQTASVVVHAGDVGAGDLLEALAGTGARVIAVAGNNDTARHWPQADLDVLAALPATASIELPGGLLVVEHGHRFPARTRHARLRREYPPAAAVVCGHSHRSVLDYSARPWILNPGACGRSRAFGGPGCLLLHAAARAWTIEEYRFEPLVRRRTRGRQ